MLLYFLLSIVQSQELCTDTLGTSLKFCENDLNSTFIGDILIPKSNLIKQYEIVFVPDIGYGDLFPYGVFSTNFSLKSSFCFDINLFNKNCISLNGNPCLSPVYRKRVKTVQTDLVNLTTAFYYCNTINNEELADMSYCKDPSALFMNYSLHDFALDAIHDPNDINTFFLLPQTDHCTIDCSTTICNCGPLNRYIAFDLSGTITSNYTQYNQYCKPDYLAYKYPSYNPGWFVNQSFNFLRGLSANDTNWNSYYANLSLSNGNPLNKNLTTDLSSPCYCYSGYYSNTYSLGQTSLLADVSPNYYKNYFYKKNENLIDVNNIFVNNDGFINISYFELNDINLHYCTSSINELDLTVSCDVNGQVLITKGSISLLLNMSDSFLLYTFSPDFIIKTETLEIKVFYSNKMIYDVNYYFTGQSYCVIKDCILCTDTFNNLHCFPYWQRVLFIFLFILASLFLLMIIYMIIGPLITCFWCFQTILCYIKKIFCCLMIKGTKSVKNTRNYIDTSNTTDENDQVTTPLNDKKSISKRRTSGPSIQLLPLIVTITICLFQTVESCENNPTIISSLTNCIYGSNSRTCNVEFDLNFVLPYIGSESCYQLLDEHDNLIAYINITYVSEEFTAIPQFQYWTSDWIGISSNSWNCDGVSGCGSDCSTAANSNTANGHITGIISNCPGYSRCQRTPGCWGNGCFLCSDACSYQRWATQPIGEQYSVFNIIGFKTNYFVHVEITNVNNNDLITLYNKTLMITPEELNIDDKYTFQLVGAYTAPTQINLNNLAYLKSLSGALYAIGPYSLPNSPLPGIIGDIQASDPSQLSCNSWQNSKNVQVSPDLVILNSISSVSFKKSSFNSLTLLPAFLNTQFWYDNGGFLTTNLTVPNPLALEWSTNTPVKIQQTTTIVCPKIELINTTGCYNCDIGFQIYFYLKSTCLPGLIFVTSDICVDTSYKVNSINSIFIINCQSDKQNLDITLTAISGSNQDSGTISASLDFIAKIGINEYSVDNHTNIEETSNGNINWNGFDTTIFGIPLQLNKMWNIFINIMLILLISIVFVVIIRYYFRANPKGYEKLRLKE